MTRQWPRARPPGLRPRALTFRLLVGVAMPMTLLALALGLGGTLLIRATVDAVNDRILEAAARGIADSLLVEDGEVALDLPPTIFGMLENTARDNVYYGVFSGSDALTGYGDLPRVAPGVDGAAAFASAAYLGRPVRIVSLARRLPGAGGVLVVEVSETLDARVEDARRLLLALFALEAALVLVALLFLPLAVRWGLAPLARLRGDLDRRAASDLAPVPLSSVPAELRDLVRAFNAMLERLDGVLAATRRFTGDASHQMRTPLSILRTHVAVLREAPPGGPEARQSIDDIEAGAVRLGHLIAQLLALARADNLAPGAAAAETVDLARLARDVAADLGPTAARAGSSVLVEARDPRPARAAPSLVAEILSNLVDNAVRHGGPGTVRVVAGPGPTVSVEDEGPGIPPADRERVFERFARLAPYGAAGGTGLGLSIARALARAAGAELSLATGASGRGLRAELQLPEKR